MIVVDLIIAILIVRYLRKTLQTAVLLPAWDKILTGVFFISIGLLAADIFFGRRVLFLQWGGHAVLLFLLYILYSKKEFKPARSYMIAIFPYVLVRLTVDILKTFFNSFYNTLNNYADAAILFAVIWLIAMLVINKKQQKALAKEQEKRKQEEEQNKITVLIKEQLEVQVAERTAELTKQKEELQNTLHELQSTQSLLIQSEKMASLGELTAGIAHEIQNPLNFVNNFSEVNTELIAEMKDEIEKGNFEEVKALANDIADNEQKINHHGKRADAIVKGMLQHSRSSSGQKEPTNISALADEYLRLAYHGLRAKDKSFNAAMKTDYDQTIGTVNVLPQDIGRVILNLITNAFYSVQQKKTLRQAQGDNSYEPTVAVSTKKTGDKVQIKVADNGNGIPQSVLDKIFQPFFTTKPTGQGTGLGLSLSYDIIKAHSGELKVENKEGEGAAFIIILPA